MNERRGEKKLRANFDEKLCRLNKVTERMTRGTSDYRARPRSKFVLSKILSWYLPVILSVLMYIGSIHYSSTHITLTSRYLDN